MIILINAGGSGTRLWPLSTKDLPKQFLSLIGNQSLLQSAYERASKLATKDKIYISTSENCKDIVAQQIPDISHEQIITEPCRKDTMGSVLNSAQYIASRHSNDEPIASINSDQFIKHGDRFNEDIGLASEVSKKESRIVLLGMEPDKPGPKFGHIKKGSVFNSTRLFEVQGFKEKPDLETAIKYFQSGEYLFNAGSFIASYKIFKQNVAEVSPEWLSKLNQLEKAKTKEDRDTIYETFENISMDIGLIEKVKDLLVLPQSYSWVDLGSFDDVYAVNKKDENNNSTQSSNRVISIDSKGTYINSTGHNKPIAVVGLDHIIVIDTPEGLLIAGMDHAQEVKKISDILEA
jgi:mannose-1-phosphate guanylyltransferase/mannose-6-phosphate isomerase